MASNPPGRCCFEGFLHEGTPSGEYKEIFGLKTYVAEPAAKSTPCADCDCGSTEKKKKNCDKVIVILTDVFGNTLNNTLLIADDLAKQGFQVLIPDILLGDAIGPDDMGKPGFDFYSWLPKHTPEITKPIVDDFCKKVKQELSPQFLGVVGYCFGAKYAFHQIAKETGVADCCAVAHPSFVSIEEVAAVDKPVLISAAETDQIFPAELRHSTEDKLKEIGARYQLDLFSGVQHGFAVRGDISDPMVKYAKEKALIDQIHWFKTFSA